MTYNTFLPSYYSNMVKILQRSLIEDDTYIFIADGVNQEAIANNSPKTDKSEQEVISQIILGGKFTPSDILPMIRKIEWKNGKVFSQYDSRDPNLYEKDFYCITSTRQVYKCIENNNGNPSLIEPSTIVPGPFTLSDGYVWIFMFKLTNNQYLDFSVGDYIPIFETEGVANSAVIGSISSINVVDGGVYPNTHKGTVRTIISNTNFRIDDDASPVSGIYNQMGFYNEVGSVVQIRNYIANSSGKYIETVSPITGIVNGSGIEITPYVDIKGNGYNGVARTIVENETITKIDVINRGIEYTMANVAIVANTVYGNYGGIVEINLSPPKGHGGDVITELYTNHVLYKSELDNYSFEDYPVNDITFSKIGILKNAKSANGEQYEEVAFNNTFGISVTPITGSFAVGDKISTNLLSNNVMGTLVFANSSYIVGTYDNPNTRYNSNNVIVNENGVRGSIINIRQPDTNLSTSDILSIVNTDTIKRSDNSREIIQVLVKLK